LFPDLAYNEFKDRFKVMEIDGVTKVFGILDDAGNLIFYNGKPASFDEALEYILREYLGDRKINHIIIK
jgi:hypothetical protein